MIMSNDNFPCDVRSPGGRQRDSINFRTGKSSSSFRNFCSNRHHLILSCRLFSFLSKGRSDERKDGGEEWKKVEEEIFDA